MADSRVVYPTVCPGHTMGVWEMHYAATPEGLFFISACHDKLPMLRDGVNGDWIGTFEGHSGAVWSAKLNRNASIAVTGSADSTAKLWNAITGDLIHTFDHKRVVRTVDFSPDGTRIVTGGYEPVLRVFDANSPSSPPIAVEHPGGSRIKKAAWSSDGRLIYTGDEAGTVRVWDVASMRVVRDAAVVRGVPEGIMDMELSLDGGVLTVSGGKTVALLSAADLSPKATHTLSYDVEAASLHPVHGKYFIAGGADVRVRVHDAATGAELFTQRGHHGRVHSVRFAPGGETYSSGADDATIRLWKFDEADLNGPSPSPVAATSSGAGATAGPHGAGPSSGAAAAAASVAHGRDGPMDMPPHLAGPAPHMHPGYPPVPMPHPHGYPPGPGHAPVHPMYAPGPAQGYGPPPGQGYGPGPQPGQPGAPMPGYPYQPAHMQGYYGAPPGAPGAYPPHAQGHYMPPPSYGTPSLAHPAGAAAAGQGGPGQAGSRLAPGQGPGQGGPSGGQPGAPGGPPGPMGYGGGGYPGYPPQPNQGPYGRPMPVAGGYQ